MNALKWSQSHAVFVPEIDDEHQEIFEAISHLSGVLSENGSLREIRPLVEQLTTSVVDHFAHEERLMRAARYDALRWHKQQHSYARRRVGQFAARIEKGEAAAGAALIVYLKSWLHNHTRIADRMMAAFLRNHERGVWKLMFRAGTRAAGSCAWVDAAGRPFNPETGTSTF